MYFKASHIEKRWREVPVDAGVSADIARDLRCSAIVADLLARRCIESAEDGKRFLDPNLRDLVDPDLLPGIDAAADQIVEAIRTRKSVTIYGDYDVDGVSSTALLSEFFRFAGHEARTYIPQRLGEGYGMNSDAVRRIAADGTDVIVTVDNGSSAVEEIELAQSLGMSVVVTDHHVPSDPLPKPDAFVNPMLPGSRYPFPQLAGVGVAFKVVWAIARRFSRSRKVSREFREFMTKALGFVALGTICDVVPLRGENRILASYGLRALDDGMTPGLRALAGLVRRGSRRRPLEASDVGFRIGPCINSAGRLGDAADALELLTTPDEGRAAEVLRQLVRQNERRRRIEKKIHVQARSQVLENVDLGLDRAVVVAGEGWHPGVIGIVAARLVDEFYRPTLLISLDGDTGKGSARSIPQVKIRDAIARVGDCLRRFGGHAQAAGLTIASDRVGEFRELLNQAIEVEPEEMIPEVEIDGEYDLLEWTPKLLREIQKLAPFGSGNREPLFVSHDVEIVGSPRLLGRDAKHLSFIVRQGKCKVRAVAFGMGELFPKLNDGKHRLSVLYQPVLSDWSGKDAVELLVREVKFADESIPS